MTQPDLHIKNLHVAVGDTTLVKVDDLAIHHGDVCAILGPNGAGKSTLLKACLGFMRPRSGEANLLGKDVTTMSRWQITKLRRQVAYIPQHLPAHGQLPLTLREVVSIGRTGIRGPWHSLSKADNAIIDEALSRFGLDAIQQRPFAHLSGGEQRKAMIARGIVQKPRILILDEPTANLDLGSREHVVNTIQSAFEQAGCTVILVCHELEVIPPCCRRVVMLEAGGVHAVGTPEDVLTEECVRRLYGHQLQVLHQNGRHAVVPFETEASA